MGILAQNSFKGREGGGGGGGGGGDVKPENNQIFLKKEKW